MRASGLGLVLLVLLILGCAANSTPGPQPSTGTAIAASAASGDALTGAWRVLSLRYKWADGEATIDPALPGLFLFADGHYSFIWHQGDEPQADYATSWKPTDAEKVQSYNAIVVNAGRYALRGDSLITWPLVAKTPEFEGGEAHFTWRLMGDTLRLDGGSILNRHGMKDPGGERFAIRSLCIRER
jgi:hypothetical protein